MAESGVLGSNPAGLVALLRLTGKAPIAQRGQTAWFSPRIEIFGTVAEFKSEYGAEASV